MTDLLEDRIHVVTGPSTLGVTLALGETLITVKSPRPPGSLQLSEEHLRATALRLAQRALEVGQEELAAAR